MREDSPVMRTILPTRREHPFAPQRRLLIPHWRSCYYWYLREPASGRQRQSTHRAESVAYLNILVCHPDVIRICLQILWCGHDGKLYRPLISKRLVRPFSHTADFLYGRNTVVRNKDLEVAQLISLLFSHDQLAPGGGMTGAPRGAHTPRPSSTANVGIPLKRWDCGDN
jgi:hypothetical protein